MESVEKLRTFFSLQEELKELSKAKDLPLWIVCGLQSRGKSSLLEALIETKFNFTASQTGTIILLNFRICNDSKESNPYWKLVYRHRLTGKVYDKTSGDTTWIKNKLSSINTQAHEQILSQNNYDDFLDREIYLELHWSNVCDITFIDMPGVQLNTSEDKAIIKEYINKLYDKIIENYPNSLLLIVERAGEDFNGLGGFQFIKDKTNPNHRIYIVINKLDEISQSGIDLTMNTLTELNKQTRIKKIFLTIASGGDIRADFGDKIEEWDTKCEDIYNDNFQRLVSTKVVIPCGIQSVRECMSEDILGRIIDLLPDIVTGLEDNMRKLISEKHLEDTIRDDDITKFIDNESSRLDGNIVDNFRSIWDWRLKSGFMNNNISSFSGTVIDEVNDGIRPKDAYFKYQELGIMTNPDIKGIIDHYCQINDVTGGSTSVRRVLHQLRYSVYYSKMPIETGNPKEITNFLLFLKNIASRPTSVASGTNMLSQTVNQLLKQLVPGIFHDDIEIATSIIINILIRTVKFAIVSTWHDLKLYDNNSDNETMLEHLTDLFIVEIRKNIVKLVNNFRNKINYYLEDIISSVTRPKSNDDMWENVTLDEKELADNVGKSLISNSIYGHEYNINVNVNVDSDQKMVIDLIVKLFGHIRRSLFDIIDNVYINEIQQPLFENFYIWVTESRKEFMSKLKSNNSQNIDALDLRINRIKQLIEELNKLK